MRPRKTDKAHRALRDRPSDLSALERRVLILSDGIRAADQLAALLGAAAPTALPRLLREGYLIDGDAGTAPPSAIAPSPPAAAPASRRSLAAAKVYMFDMLQLQRGAEAGAIATALRGCRDQDELVVRLVQALRHVRAVASPSYSHRVAERLAELMPEPYLFALGALRESPLAAAHGDSALA
ncbi:hypothetical protein [Luteimonas aquatica]|uniref:hypothetical protein n=1 Tax=Luteimonas aquatica TaxID=450364 RepID=UPI001F5A8A1B|nr:hypothetical protein [Luteimonas aquatica]